MFRFLGIEKTQPVEEQVCRLSIIVLLAIMLIIPLFFVMVLSWYYYIPYAIIVLSGIFIKKTPFKNYFFHIFFPIIIFMIVASGSLYSFIALPLILMYIMYWQMEYRLYSILDNKKKADHGMLKNELDMQILVRATLRKTFARSILPTFVGGVILAFNYLGLGIMPLVLVFVTALIVMFLLLRKIK